MVDAILGFVQNLAQFCIFGQCLGNFHNGWSIKSFSLGTDDFVGAREGTQKLGKLLIRRNLIIWSQQL